MNTQNPDEDFVIAAFQNTTGTVKVCSNLSPPRRGGWDRVADGPQVDGPGVAQQLGISTDISFLTAIFQNATGTVEVCLLCYRLKEVA